MKGSITLTANQENSLDDQGGEEVVNNTANGLQYLRTSWRVVIVKDTQSNSTDANITWDMPPVVQLVFLVIVAVVIYVRLETNICRGNQE